MDEIIDGVIKLSVAVKESKLYQEYQASQAEILKNPELVSKIGFFKKIQYDFESRLLRDGESSFDDEKYVSKLYSDLCMNEEVRQFLHAERELLCLIRKIQNIMHENFEINTSFLDVH